MMCYIKKEIVKRISNKLIDTKIVVGGHKNLYKRKYHLKYTQVIIENVLTAFFEVLAEVIEDGDTAMFIPYVKVEPKKKRVRDFGKEKFVEYFVAKITGLSRFKNACRRLEEQSAISK